jgi:hypothetical protein
MGKGKMGCLDLKTRCDKEAIAHLHTDIINVQERDSVRCCVHASHSLRSQRDEVVVQSLAHEREGPTGPQVTFDDLHIVTLGHELNVERTRDTQA